MESNLTYIRDTEKANVLLQKCLLCALYFLKWKTKAAFTTLTDERKLFDAQRRQIWNELVVLREHVASANRQETALLTTASHRGADVLQFLEMVRGDMARAQRVHNSKNDSYTPSSRQRATPTPSSQLNKGPGGNALGISPATRIGSSPGSAPYSGAKS